MRITRALLMIATTLALAFAQAGCSDGSDNAFSPQQFETQAMRFTSNGYPQEMLFAFENDTSLMFRDDTQ